MVPYSHSQMRAGANNWANWGPSLATRPSTSSETGTILARSLQADMQPNLRVGAASGVGGASTDFRVRSNH
jgi:hypothetical protein